MPPATSLSPWQRRIRRAQELAGLYPSAAEVLTFYICIAGLQENLQGELRQVLDARPPSSCGDLDDREVSELSSRFGSFLSLAERHAPAPLAELTLQLRASGTAFWSELLRSAWNVSSPSDATGILAQIFLQPYAEWLASRGSLQPFPHADAICPFCRRKPGFGVLRPMGDGAARSLACSFCMAEWEFRRIVCPGCGEEDDKKLAVFTADEFPCIRVECCDSCRTYLKTIDLTKDGYAEPVVDELASAPLDLWARERGYAKLRSNLLGL
jgi:formate dehydrogenase accessory protein FdhE